MRSVGASLLVVVLHVALLSELFLDSYLSVIARAPLEDLAFVRSLAADLFRTYPPSTKYMGGQGSECTEVTCQAEREINLPEREVTGEDSGNEKETDPV